MNPRADVVSYRIRVVLLPPTLCELHCFITLESQGPCACGSISWREIIFTSTKRSRLCLCFYTLHILEMMPANVPLPLPGLSSHIQTSRAQLPALVFSSWVSGKFHDLSVFPVSHLWMARATREPTYLVDRGQLNRCMSLGLLPARPAGSGAHCCYIVSWLRVPEIQTHAKWARIWHHVLHTQVWHYKKKKKKVLFVCMCVSHSFRPWV